MVLLAPRPGLIDELRVCVTLLRVQIKEATHRRLPLSVDSLEFSVSQARYE
jgi:hypothetical protein